MYDLHHRAALHCCSQYTMYSQNCAAFGIFSVLNVPNNESDLPNHCSLTITSTCNYYGNWIAHFCVIVPRKACASIQMRRCLANLYMASGLSRDTVFLKVQHNHARGACRMPTSQRTLENNSYRQKEPCYTSSHLEDRSDREHGTGKPERHLEQWTSLLALLRRI